MNTIRIIKAGDSEYPDGFKRLHDPPRRLFALGNVLPTSKPVLSVVGSRKASAYGRQAVDTLIRGLSGTDTIIVSGLALGIDGLAHRAALSAGLTTVAVLPSGLDQIYPASHRSLAKQILSAGGTLLSEYSPGTRAAKYHFPARNRLIAAMANAVLVVEAAARSGSLITAEHALDVGVTVLAVPGPINSPQSVGVNRLIQLGAGAVTNAEDIRHELDLPTSRQAVSVMAQNPEEQLIIDCLKGGERTANQLQAETKLQTQELNRLLTSLELSGSVRNQGNNTWSLSY